MKSNASTLHLPQPQHHPHDDGRHKDLPPLQNTPSTADISAGSGLLLDEGDIKHHMFSLDVTSSSPSGAGEHQGRSQQDLSAGGYGWYDNEESMGSMSPYGGGEDDNDSRGSGWGAVRVLSRMETFREDMMERTAAVGEEDGKEEDKEDQEEWRLQQPQDGSHAHYHRHHHPQHAHNLSIADESNKNSSNGIRNMGINGRHRDHRPADKEILFHLLKTDFSVMTRQFLDANDVDEFLRRSRSNRERMHRYQCQHPHQHPHQSCYQRCKRKNQPVYAALGVGGLRICQTACGGQHAEFLVCLCLNQRTFVAWKRFSAFVQLYHDGHVAHGAGRLPATRRAWDTMESRRKWWRCLEIRYLAQKLKFLESFLGAFLTEVSSPILLMKFASSDVTPEEFGNGHKFSCFSGMAPGTHGTGGDCGWRNVVVCNIRSQEEVLREKVLQGGAVSGSDSEGEDDEEGAREERCL
ncbi:hypothetical protein VYU27_005352 [Nannochloropsis oceanica]